MSNKLAQAIHPLGQPLEGLGQPGLAGVDSGTAPDVLDSVLSIIIGTLTTIAAIWFVFQIIIGAYNWMSAGGDKGAVQQAQQKITNGLIGLIIVVAAIFILDFVGTLLGLPFATSPADFIRATGPSGP
ncbi:hypothetical protein KKB40_06450 [Patescibacteria group bacterium]|nr:hypothetical protein [Patescibacteria group bacterium]